MNIFWYIRNDYIRTFDRVYVDGTWHGEIKSNSTSNRNGYQYVVTDLNCGQSYDINVKVASASHILDPYMDFLQKQSKHSWYTRLILKT